MPTLQQLETKRERLKNELAQVGDLRPGSLVGRFRKCGKVSCHCAQSASEAHGPSWSLTRAVEGKTVTKGRGKNNYQVFVVIHLLQG